MVEQETHWERVAQPDRRIGHGVEVHATIRSTSERARQLLDEEDGVGLVVVAEEQVAGRGRLGRSWASAPGRNLAMSVAVRPSLAAADAWQLGYAVALAARRACTGEADVNLKWPNDVVAPDGRKLGGLLIETLIDGDAVTGAVVGIGLNLNWPRDEMPQEIRPTATSLMELGGGPIDRVALLGRLLDALEAEVQAIEGGHSPLERYRRACSTIGRRVAVQLGERRVAGRAVGLDDSGALLVETDEGVVAVSAGEVTLLRNEGIA